MLDIATIKKMENNKLLKMVRDGEYLGIATEEYSEAELIRKEATSLMYDDIMSVDDMYSWRQYTNIECDNDRVWSYYTYVAGLILRIGEGYLPYGLYGINNVLSVLDPYREMITDMIMADEAVYPIMD